jgi:hypothetical protein
LGFFDEVGNAAAGAWNDITGRPQDNSNAQNTALNDTWKFVTNAYLDAVSFSTGGLLGLGAKKSVTDSVNRGPGAPIRSASAQPTLADAEAPVIRDQLKAERQAASASSILTGGAGLLDQPTTMSRTLLGS